MQSIEIQDRGHVRYLLQEMTIVARQVLVYWTFLVNAMEWMMQLVRLGTEYLIILRIRLIHLGLLQEV